jgi:hypothetical protein
MPILPEQAQLLAGLLTQEIIDAQQKMDDAQVSFTVAQSAFSDAKSRFDSLYTIAKSLLGFPDTKDQVIAALMAANITLS